MGCPDGLVLGGKRKNRRFEFPKIGYLGWKCANVEFQKMSRAPITKIGRASPKYFFIDPWYQWDVLRSWQGEHKETTGDFEFQR